MTLAITNEDHLVIESEAHGRIQLGKATDRRFNQLQSHIGRLRTHAVDKENGPCPS